MADYDDLIEALNRHTDALERDRIAREHNRERNLANAQARLNQAQNDYQNRRRVYTLSKGGNLLGSALLPVGILLTAGSVLTGGAIAPAIGITGAVVGAVLKLFICSNERVKELKTRAQNARAEYENAVDYVNSI